MAGQLFSGRSALGLVAVGAAFLVSLLLFQVVTGNSGSPTGEYASVCSGTERVTLVTLQLTSGGPADLMYTNDNGGSPDWTDLGTVAANGIIGPIVTDFGDGPNLRFKIGADTTGPSVHLSCSDEPYVGQTHTAGGITLTKTAPLSFG